MIGQLKPLTACLLIGLLAIIPVAFAMAGLLPLSSAAWCLSLAALGMAISAGRVDEQLKVTKALPGGASAINTDGIDLAHGSFGDHHAMVELEIVAPALTTSELPDAQTMTYKVGHDTDAAFGTVADLYGTNILVQTGAGGAGAAAATKRVRLPSDVNRYVRVTATKSGAGSAATASVIAQLRIPS